MNEFILEVQEVSRLFGHKKYNQTLALDKVSFSIPDGKATTLAIVGESGSGKSTLANLILGFYKPTEGKMIFEGKDIDRLGKSEFLSYRRNVQAVFQNPFDVFNPFYKVDHVFDMLKKFKISSEKVSLQRQIEESLLAVHLEPENILGKYSYQLSGGQLQRIMIARSLLLRPKLLIADEPVSMIDASLRVTVLDIMKKLKEEDNITQIYITHDLSTALQISENILVMYKGRIVEKGDAQKVIRQPAHPYTRLLISCIPLPSPKEKWKSHLDEGETKNTLPVSQKGCCFADRCPLCMEKCRINRPLEVEVEENHSVSCFHKAL